MDRIEFAARNNALWCDAVCRSHSLPGTFDSAAWSSPVRTPPLYPDAVTLADSTQSLDVLGRIDASGGASVKDSWAGLDLTKAGFAPIIRGEWLWLDHRPASASRPEDGRVWRVIDTADQMTRWSRTWASGSEHAAVLGPALLPQPGVYVLAATDGDDAFAVGCIANVTGLVTGITNLFATDGDEARAWMGAVAATASLACESALVGWESGDGVTAARAAGFETIGQLTVWIR